jgi:hypothetical protein
MYILINTVILACSGCKETTGLVRSACVLVYFTTYSFSFHVISLPGDCVFDRNIFYLRGCVLHK